MDLAQNQLFAELVGLEFKFIHFDDGEYLREVQLKKVNLNLGIGLFVDDEVGGDEEVVILNKITRFELANKKDTKRLFKIGKDDAD